MRKFVLVVMILAMPMMAHSQSIKFGNNTSEWSKDGECDDPRFRGVGMDNNLSDDDIGKDATDCRNAFDLGRVKLWVEEEAKAATQCSAIKFGNNASEWARDGECDDARFVGQGMSSDVTAETIGRDAKDCKAQCQAGRIFLRNY